MPKKPKSPNQNQSTPKTGAVPSSVPDSTSQFSYTHEVEEVVVRYHQGRPIGIVHPLHLACLQNTLPQPVSKGGRPSVEHSIRYILNRTVSDYLFRFGVSKPTPLPVTRYKLLKVALAWRDKERDKILQTSAPEWASEEDQKHLDADKEKRLERLIVSRNSLDTFLKRFFPKPGQHLSAKDLRRIFPRLWYD